MFYKEMQLARAAARRATDERKRCNTDYKVLKSPSQ